MSSVTCASASGAYAASYALVLGRDWRCHELTASINDGRSLTLRRTSNNHWYTGDNEEVIFLRAAIDVDLSITPSTNSLPINRLRLAAGESAEIAVCYVEFPQLSASLERQRYTRLSGTAYLFEGLNSNFSREITVVSNGLVTTYPGLFVRVA